MNELFLQIVRRYGLFSDLAQRNDRVLVVVTIQSDLSSGRNGSCPMTGQQYEIEPVLYLVDAILNGDTGHAAALQMGLSEVCAS